MKTRQLPQLSISYGIKKKKCHIVFANTMKIVPEYLFIGKDRVTLVKLVIIVCHRDLMDKKEKVIPAILFFVFEKK